MENDKSKRMPNEFLKALKAVVSFIDEADYKNKNSSSSKDV